MSDFEKDLKASLAGNGNYDPGLGQRLKKKARDSFSRRLLWVELTAMLAMVILLIVALMELHLFILATDVKQMILFAIVFLLVMEAINLMKLWYWVVNTKLNVLREVKLLRLEIQELAVAGNLPERTGRDDLLGGYEVLGVGLPNWARWVYKVALLGIVFFFLFRNSGILDNVMFASSLAPFIGEQTDTWTPIYGDQVEVSSSIILNKWPDDSSDIPITLPYPNGKLESASLDAESVAFKQVSPGQFEVKWAEPKVRAGKRTLRVQWSFPFEDLPQDDAGGWRTKLESILPTRTYQLSIRIEDGSGLEAMEGARTRLPGHPLGGEKKDENLIPFRGSGSPKMNYGSCGLMLRRKNP